MGCCCCGSGGGVCCCCGGWGVVDRGFRLVRRAFGRIVLVMGDAVLVGCCSGLAMRRAGIRANWSPVTYLGSVNSSVWKGAHCSLAAHRLSVCAGSVLVVVAVGRVHGRGTGVGGGSAGQCRLRPSSGVWRRKVRRQHLLFFPSPCHALSLTSLYQLTSCRAASCRGLEILWVIFSQCRLRLGRDKETADIARVGAE